MVSFDANVRLEVWNSARRAHDTIVDTLSNVDILKVSNDEIQFITGSNDPVEACRILRSNGPGLVVVTLGSDGCYYDAGASCGYVPGAAVEPVDTLGAGDAFLAGLLACLAPAPAAVLGDGSRLIESLRFANAVGALTTTRHGAIPALPRRVDVEQLLAAST